MLLPIVPLAALGVADEFFVSAVTGSTGAGRTPRDTTHHPLRQSNLFAYQALKHRHDPEVRSLIKAATGRDVALKFVPHSGPFARGIHATIFAKPKERMSESAGQRRAARVLSRQRVRARRRRAAEDEGHRRHELRGHARRRQWRHDRQCSA